MNIFYKNPRSLTQQRWPHLGQTVGEQQTRMGWAAFEATRPWPRPKPSNWRFWLRWFQSKENVR
jgi:hypothetical protein